MAAMGVAACGGSPPSAPTSTVSTPRIASAAPAPSASSAVPATPSAVAIVPNCANGPAPAKIATAHHPKDGVPDPAGRIVFGRLTRVDDGLGQLVSINGIDPDGSDLAQILDCETERPRFSHDGTRLAFSIAMSDGMYQVATSAGDGSDLRVIPSATPGWADTVDWTPDDSAFVYAFGDDMCVPGTMPCVLNNTWSEHLWQMNVDGSDQHLIGDPDTLDWEPRVSPDGKEVVFTRWSDNNATEFSIWVRHLATGKEWQVKDQENKPEHPDWSPDGRWIIYNTWAQDGRIERLERVPAHGPITAPTLVYGDEQHHAIKAAYSPDGSRIVFGCGGPLCVMNADGSNVQVLYDEPGVEVNHFDWGVVPVTGS
jgi:hypothetical protein